MKNLLFILASVIIFSCGKKEHVAPTKTGALHFVYKASNNGYPFDTKIELSFGTINGNATSWDYRNVKKITLLQQKSVAITFDTTITADVMQVKIVSPTMSQLPTLKYSYNGNTLYNGTIESDYFKEEKF